MNVDTKKRHGTTAATQFSLLRSCKVGLKLRGLSIGYQDLMKSSVTDPSGHLQCCLPCARFIHSRESVWVSLLFEDTSVLLLKSRDGYELLDTAQFKVILIRSFGQAGEGRNTQGQRYRDREEEIHKFHLEL